MSVELKETLKERALEILGDLSDKDIEKYYSSYLSENGGLSITTSKSKGALFFKRNRTLEVTDEFSRQVFYRYTLKKINELLSEFTIRSSSSEQIEKAESFINIYKNVERVYNNRKDNSDFDSYVRRITHLIYSSLVIEEDDSLIHVKSMHNIGAVSIKRIMLMPSFKEQKFKDLSALIKNSTMSSLKR